MKPIISVEGLGKSYTIRHEGQTHYKSLREEIFKLPSRLLRRGGQSREEFWALKDVSFDVYRGEVVGIIGHNGAGKSTLLKLLSRITEPTTGRITLRGRVASLLEVGTGFHPELTGRENIYLNGAILGMSRAEVRRKFDEIVDFAGVEKFLDTPVKRYSSGMYVRLAFAVAVHLEPEILIVDEVLAVGDMDFQKKCLGKMEEVGKKGRTVLLVSHQMSAVRQFCNRGLLLNDGTVEYDSTPSEVISAYTEEQEGADFFSWDFHSQPHDTTVCYESIRFTQAGCAVTSHVMGDEPFEVAVEYNILEEVAGFRLYLDIVDEFDVLLMRLFHDAEDVTVRLVPVGKYISKLKIPKGLLGPKQYKFIFRVGIYNLRNCSYIDGVRFLVNVVYNSGFAGPYPADTFRASINNQLPWETTIVGDEEKPC